MNILHISSLKTRSNGICTVLLDLSKEQRLLGHDVKVINLHKYSELNIDEIQSLTNFKHFILFLNDFKPDIVIFHSLYIWQYISFSRALEQRNIPFVIELHGALSIENYKKNRIKKYIANILYFNAFIKKAKGIIYLNKAEYENSIVKSINPVFMIIPNGCFLPENISKLGTNGKLEILYIGRIDIHHKGLDVLFDAIDLLIEKNISKEFHFSFYGNGEEADIKWLEERVNKISGNCASFYGPIYGEKKDEAFRKSDIFILTSRYEGMPMAILESLSYGVPCLVTPGTNMMEEVVVSNAGWGSELDSRAIASTLEGVIFNYSKISEHYSVSSRELSKIYSWSNVAQQSVLGYEKLLKRIK